MYHVSRTVHACMFYLCHPVALMDEQVLLWPLLPVIISKIHGLLSLVCMSVWMPVKVQKVDGYLHVFPVIIRCVCTCVHVFWLLFRSSPYFGSRDWSSRRTCRDLLCTAQRYFWTAVLQWDRLLDKHHFQNQFFFPIQCLDRLFSTGLLYCYSYFIT